MKNIISACTLIIVFPVVALEAINDRDLADVSGQAGLAIEIESNGFTIDQLSYSDDAHSFNINNLSVAPKTGDTAYTSKTVLDIEADGTLAIDYSSNSRDLHIEGLTLTGGGVNQNKSYGEIYSRYDIEGKIRLKGLAGNAGFDLSGSELATNFERIIYRDSGLNWIYDDFNLKYSLLNTQISATADTILLSFGDDANRGAHLELGIGAIGLDVSGSPADLDGSLTDVFGALTLDIDVYGDTKIQFGGASGEGFKFIPNLTLVNDDPFKSAISYIDDGYFLSVNSLKGTYGFANEEGFVIDLDSDAESTYINMGFSGYTFAVHLGDVVLGGTDLNANTIASIGSEFNFRDGLVDGTAYTNNIKLRPGGDTFADLTDTEGLSIDLEWNITSDDIRPHDTEVGAFKPGLLNTHLVLSDNDRFVMFNGFNSHARGRITLDLTSESTAVVGDPNIYSDHYDGHFDGLRVGLHNFEGGYSFDGVTVGYSEADAFEAPLMGGTELLLSLEVFPAYDLTINGHVTLKPGDPNAPGEQGITVNSDIYITNGTAALTVNEAEEGIWLTGVAHETHLRDASVNITEDGLTVNKGFYWSNMEIDDIKFGDKTTGASLGSFSLQRVEQGSTISIASGGAGVVCVGGMGVDAASCGASGGRFEDRGDEGLTVKLKNIYVEDDPDSTADDIKFAGKGNNLSWTQPNGVTIALDKFATSDGDPANPKNNSYGFNVDLNIDVFETLVYDTNGDKVLADPTGPLGAAGEGPLGFAVQGRIHFKQFEIERLTIAGPAGTGSAAPKPLIHGIIIQNADIIANLTATPIL
jgi:hypothetical protein